MANRGSTGHHWHLSAETKAKISMAKKGKPQSLEVRKKRGIAIRIAKGKHPNERILTPPDYYERTKGVFIRLSLEGIERLNKLTDNSTLLRNGVIELLITKAAIVDNIRSLMQLLEHYNISCTSHNEKPMTQEFIFETIKNAIDRHLENLKNEESPAPHEVNPDEKSSQ
ncbi:hypothetical protein MUP77_04575 [Candidatus Bathyarchaeota archaeon]|nr:hypothetical protein [Candidatus Bathyarchaeota archaeon]